MKINHRSIGKTEPTGRWFCIAEKYCRMTEEIKVSNIYRQRFLLAEIIEYTASGTATACDSG
jgi:hypothetical protein